jgi:hypothetical protein
MDLKGVVALGVLGIVAGTASGSRLTLSLVDNTNNFLPGFGPFTDNDAVTADAPAGTNGVLEFSLDGGDLDAMHRLPNGNWLVSSLFNGTFGGVTFDDGDLVEIDPSSGAFVQTVIPNTVFTTPGPDFTAVSQLPDGNLLFSMLGSSNTITTPSGPVTFTDGDIMLYNVPTGDVSVFIAEADLFDDGDGDVYGIHHMMDGTLLLTTNVDESISGTTYRDGDVFRYDPTNGSTSLFFSEDTFIGGNTWDVDGLYWEIPAPGAAGLLGLAGLAAARRRRG